MLDLGVRPWFLAAATYAIVSTLIWVSHLNGMPIFGTGYPMPRVIWHAHEMLFGFAMACATGVLLTATQTWSQALTLRGSRLVALLAFWLFARLCLWQGWVTLALLFQGLWWLLFIAFFAAVLAATSLQRDYTLVAMLLALATLNLAVLANGARDIELALHLLRTSVLAIGVMMGVLTSRIIPALTLTVLPSLNVRSSRLMDHCVLWVSLVGTGMFLVSGLSDTPLQPAYLMLLAGLMHCLRALLWGVMRTFRAPLLWSLHLSYLMLGVGLITLGASYFIHDVDFADALHLITMGAMGSLILSMMVQVWLGHLGRPFKVTRTMSCAFALVLLSAVLRFSESIAGDPLEAWQLSSALWVIAFSLCAAQFYFPLIRPRRDQVPCTNHPSIWSLYAQPKSH